MGGETGMIKMGLFILIVLVLGFLNPILALLLAIIVLFFSLKK